MCSERLKTHNAARQKAQLPEHIVAEYIALLTEYNKVRDSALVVFDKVSSLALYLCVWGEGKRC